MAAILTAALLACTNYSQVPPDAYTELETSPRHGYRVKTRHGEEYIVTRMAIQDSVLIVQQTKDSPADTTSVPFSLQRAEIDSIEKIDKNYASPIVLGACIVALLIALDNALDDIPAMD